MSLVVGLLVGLLPTLPMSAAAAPPRLAVADELARDQSTGLPYTQHGEGTGDFMGLGYDQRARIEDGYLNIYAPPDKGGGVLRSTVTDLESNAKQIDEALTAGLSVFTDPVVWTPSALFLAGYRTSDKRPIVYRVTPDGRCATADCATAPGWTKLDLPAFNFVVAMAATTIGNTPVLAVGTSTNGIYLLRQSDGTQIGSVFTGCGGFDLASPVKLTTAMAFAPPDSPTPGVLSYGCFAGKPNGSARAVTFAENGSTSDATSWTGGISGAYPIATAIGRRSDGTLLSAYGFTDGSVILMNPKLSGPTPLARTADADKDSKPIDGLTFVDRWDDDAGATQDLVAVSSASDTGRVFRFAGGSGLVAQAVAPAGDTTTDVGGIRSWFPGYKTGRLRFLSIVDEPVQIAFAAGSEPGSGCWFGAATPGRQAFPDRPIRIEKSVYSPYVTVGGLTAGTNGNCAATDSTGQWSAYLIVTPLRHPQDVLTAKLTLSRGGVLSVKTANTTTASGTTLSGSVRLIPKPTPGSYILGDWQIGLDGPPAPTRGTPSMTGKQLDPAGTTRPVYRFDVSASTYKMPVRQPPRMSAVLEPLQVQALRPGAGWTDLGLLVPQGQPARATTGTVTLAPVSFYFQNPDGEPPYTAVRVTGGDVSNAATVLLSDIPVPAPITPPAEITACPTNGSQLCDGNADPYDNGLDQAPLKIQISDASGAVLPVTNGGPYGRVYYRDDNGDLVTGLIPADGTRYVRVSPYAGAFPNDGTSGSAPRPPVNAPVGGRFGYLTTTSTDLQRLTAVVDGVATSDPIVVTAQEFSPQATQQFTGVQGFHITGCPDFKGTSYCRVAKATATAPALFHTTDPDTGQIRIGLLFTTLAQSAGSSLPLRQTAGSEHTVAAATLSVNNGEVSLDTTTGFRSNDTFDTWVVSHGEAVAVRTITVGG